ncbi:run domain Beclin-1-interacting and cysteine-rich domain-containing protein rubicon isoform X3 [Dermacentor variabilis]|uniref:run domain Beclin-1-interacting and cysteine-rich domain-containing protein rubicon isoform X3 n=1 Tax=Dermacentor variabilis TaxID=34621 RepID=UPI003F5AE40B
MAALDQSMTASRARRAHHVRSRSDLVGLVPPAAQMRTSTSYPAQLMTTGRRSFLDEGRRLVPATECFFPTPRRGQSLTSFLSSADFGTCGELDRENAHIYVSEALIAAFEQMRCSRAVRVAEDDDQDDSDEEIACLRQRIRIRRKERLREKALIERRLSEDGKHNPGWCCVDIAVNTVATTNTSPLSSAYSSPCFQADLSDNDGDVDEYELSDADLQKTSSVCWPQEDASQTCSSAEAVALNLLKRFSEKQLPKASDLQWLVSEQDAAQSLLPLPDAWPVSPDEVEEEYYSTHKMRLRGNSEWAPPRAQIIFNMQPELKRKDQLAKQNYRCAGCGLRVNQAQLGRLRYCEYLGKLFCHCCHRNSRAVIPGRVLQRWDFSPHPVSNFARDLLDRMAADPLFNVRDLNPSLFRRIKALDRIRQCRIALHYLQQYIHCCRHATRLQDSLGALRPHLLAAEPHLYSLEELEQARQGTLLAQLRGLQEDCERHCLSCPICTGRGFICEICNNADQLVFPFQLTLAAQCTGCKASFHRTCFVPGACPKCRRLETRRQSMLEADAALA